MTKLKWAKQGTGWSAAEGPFAMTATPKGDGRWDWAVFADAGVNPTATGVRSSVGAAKTAAEQFVARSGRV
jgi:hypothetical protein